MIKLLSLTASPSPGPEPLTWARVREGVSWFFSNLSPAFVWPLFGLLIVAAFFAYYWWCLRPRPRSLEWIALAEEKSAPRRLTLTLKHHPMERGDALPLLLLTAVYALTAFFQLGDFNAPQSMVKFQQGDSYEFSYNQPVTVDTVSLYTSLGTGYYTLEWEEEDGQWHSLRPEQYYNSLFKWHILELDRNVDQNGLEITKDNDNLDAEPLGPITAARFRITASSAPRDEGLWLSELALWSGGQALPQPDHVDDGAAALFDEYELWSDQYTYMNSTYFDEIYHPRTAYEHLNNVYPYEVSHPPLGKLIISIGIAMFGMVPFGWRFMGTLFGVLMVPILYVFLKNLFGKTPVALCGAALFTFDFMHLVQTRIATIDTYGVFFILVSYYFMYRWLAVPAGKKLRHYVLPLFLSGLFWGAGCASKWTVVYAGAGLALLWLLGMIFKAGDWHEAELAAQTQPVPPEVRREVTEAMFREEQPAWTPPRVPSFTAHAWGTVGLSVVFFVVIPLMIYTASYFPYAAAKGNGGSFLELAGQSAGWFWECLPERLEQYPEQMARVTENLAREGKTPGVADRIGAFFQAIPDQSGNPVDLMLRNQYFMLTYHQSVHTPHPYQSNWYQWIIDARPILYYQDFSTPGMRGIFASFNNPLVSWAGLLAFFAVAVQMVRRKCGKALFIVLATLSQLVPWTAIGRVLFAYHYFPTVLFLCFAIAYLMDDMLNRKREGARLAVYGFTGCTGLLYAIFYPELIGISVPNWYATYFLRWFPSWPL